MSLYSIKKSSLASSITSSISLTSTTLEDIALNSLGWQLSAVANDLAVKDLNS